VGPVCAARRLDVRCASFSGKWEGTFQQPPKPDIFLELTVTAPDRAVLEVLGQHLNLAKFQANLA